VITRVVISRNESAVCDGEKDRMLKVRRAHMCTSNGEKSQSLRVGFSAGAIKRREKENSCNDDRAVEAQEELIAGLVIELRLLYAVCFSISAPRITN
jgi:hypothetical protein